jgi:peptide/nickel transport system substrate-binding protein
VKKHHLVLAFTFLALLGIVMAACGGEAPTIPGGQQATYNYTPPGQQGGTILMSDWQFPASTNPWFNTSVVGYEVGNALYGYPYVVSSDGKLLPDQLTEIPTQANGDVSADGLTVTMRLNPNLKWSDGQPLTSADYLYWIKVLLDPATGAASTTGFDPGTLASYTAPDPHTVVLHYKAPFAPYLFYLPNAAPLHAWGKIPDKNLMNTPAVNLAPTVTSGPFMVQNYASGQSFTLVPNKFYTSTSLHPSALHRLVFKGYETKDALIAGYNAGETDHAEDFTLGDLQKLSGLPGLRVTPAIEYEHLDPNLTNPVLRNVYVRRAIEQAIDRCGLIQGLLHQPCNTLAVNQLEPPPHPDADPTIQMYPFNLQAARADMQAAGWDCSTHPCTKGGQPFPALNLVTTSGNQLRTDTAQLIQQDLAALGIPVNLDGQSYPAGVLFADRASNGILATGKYDLALFAYSEGMDSDSNLYPSFHSSQIPTAANPAGANYSRVADPKVDHLLQQGRVTMNTTKRSNIYKQLQKYIIGQVYTIPLYMRPNITLTDNRVSNYFPNPTAAGNEWNVGEWWQKAAS